MSKCQCQQKRKHREEKEYRCLVNRLNRIEGQIRGIKNMLENDAYCTDILIQVSAVSAALNAFNKELLSNHIHTCVAENIRQGNDSVIDELVVTLQKLMK
ncbi:MAG: metal-sensing transcriptional repressor [Acutalibacteraceae bacterium]